MCIFSQSILASHVRLLGIIFYISQRATISVIHFNRVLIIDHNYAETPLKKGREKPSVISVVPSWPIGNFVIGFLYNVA